jgi:hypothetical protein
VSALSQEKLRALDRALTIALDLPSGRSLR